MNSGNGDLRGVPAGNSVVVAAVDVAAERRDAGHSGFPSSVSKAVCAHAQCRTSSYSRCVIRSRHMNAALFRALVASVPVATVLVWSAALLVKRRTEWSSVQFLGAGCLTVVVCGFMVVAHV